MLLATLGEGSLLTAVRARVKQGPGSPGSRDAGICMTKLKSRPIGDGQAGDEGDICITSKQPPAASKNATRDLNANSPSARSGQKTTAHPESPVSAVDTAHYHEAHRPRSRPRGHLQRRGARHPIPVHKRWARAHLFTTRLAPACSKRTVASASCVVHEEGPGSSLELQQHQSGLGE